MINYYNYYLIAINYNGKGVEPKLINLNNEMLKESDEKELTNLAYIDNLTSKYDEGTFRRYLFEKGIINNLYTPVYVVRLSKSYLTDKDGKRKAKTNIKYHCPVFKSNASSLISNISLTTIRQRSLSLTDTTYLLKTFEELYYTSEEFRNIVAYVINEHDIKHLLNYNYYINDTKSNPIKYNLLRDVVSTIYEYEKNKTYEKFMNYVYDRNDYVKDIVSILPEKIVVKKADLNPIVKQSLDELKEMKYTEWDNKVAKEQFEKGTIADKVFWTLTLEDKLRAGLIDPLEFSNIKEKYEIKFRK